MGFSFKISKKGTRFRPKQHPQSDITDEVDTVKNESAPTPKLLAGVSEGNGDVADISEAEVSFILNLFPDGYSIGNPSVNEAGQQTAAQEVAKVLHPFDRTSDTLFSAIESGRLPGDILDDIPCKYVDGSVVCEVRDYRKCTSELGVNVPSTDGSPIVNKVHLKMSLENVVKDIPLISDDAWTYRDLMEVESRILKILQPQLCLDPTPKLDRLCENPASTKLNLTRSNAHRKRLRQMAEVDTTSNKTQGKKGCTERGPESSSCRLGDSGSILQHPTLENLATQCVGQSNMLGLRSRGFAQDTSIPVSPSVSNHSKYHINMGNQKSGQEQGTGPVFSTSGVSPSGQDLMNSYADNMNSTMSSIHGKRENPDGQLSPLSNLNKRSKPNAMVLDGTQQQHMVSHMDGFNGSDSHWKNTLIPQQSVTRGIQYNNTGVQKYPHQMFDGGFNQEPGAMPFAMGQQGIRYNLKQEPVESERLDKPELHRNKNEMHMAEAEINHVDSQQARLQQRLPQHFTRNNFPQTAWNSLGQPLEISSRKEDQFPRRKLSQSPRVSAGGLPQSPLSSKSGEFSSGSMGPGFGAVAATAALASSQKEKSAVNSVPAIGGTGSLTSSANDSMQRQHQTQIPGNRRSNSVPKTPAMSGVGSPASVSNMGVSLNAGSPPVGTSSYLDKGIRDRFSKIEMFTARYQLNCKKNKVDEFKKTTIFTAQQLNHHLSNDSISENIKDETCKMPLSKSLVGGSMNICKMRVLSFVQGNGYQDLRTRLTLSEKPIDGTVAMLYGEREDGDYLAAEECLPTIPNTHMADLLAAQFCSLIIREGFSIEGDLVHQRPIHMARASNGQPNAPGASAGTGLGEMQQISEAAVGQPHPSYEVAKPSNGGNNNNMSINPSHNMASTRMLPPGNSQGLQMPQAGLLPGAGMPTSKSQLSDPQPPIQQQQNQHSLMQQHQLQRSSAAALMLPSNPLSHLSAMGQNPNMQQLGNHMLNKTSSLQLQLLQQQHQQHPQMQRKMMMGLANVGMGNIGNNNMVGLQGLGNVVGMGGPRGGTGISPAVSGGPISGMGNNMVGQTPMNISQASNISNVLSQQLRSGALTPAQAQMMASKFRMVQNRANLLGGPGQAGGIGALPGANRQMHPGASGLSMLGPGMNRPSNMNQMQRTAMAPPKLMSGMNLYMNQQQQLQLHQMQQQQQLQQQQQQQQLQQQQPQPQPQPQPQQQQLQQESTSPLQAVVSPPQQMGSPSTMGVPQQPQASPQQMNQRTPMSPQLSSGAIHPPMSAGNNQEASNCPASPQLSSQTLGSVSSMAHSPMELQGVNKSS